MLARHLHAIFIPKIINSIHYWLDIKIICLPLPPLSNMFLLVFSFVLSRFALFVGLIFPKSDFLLAFADRYVCAIKL